MVDLAFILKGIILTEVLTNAAREWGIFDRQRKWIKSKSDFLRTLLDCFECSAVYAGLFVVLYLSYFEVVVITYALIFHRIACFIKIFYLNLDWIRANKEQDFQNKLKGGK